MKDLQIPYDPAACDPAIDEEMTVIYYTANRVEEAFGERVRQHLKTSAPAASLLVSVSQKPLPDFGHNLCLGDIGFSIYNVYVQLLVGAKAATTPWIACAEDDYLYHPSHFKLRPPRDAFGYNQARWMLDGGTYWYRSRATMGMCIVWRDLLLDTLEEKFAKFPTPPTTRAGYQGWGEPGRYESNLGLTLRKMTIMHAEGPTVIFNHRPSLGGKRRRRDTDRVTADLPPWGNGMALWTRFYDG